MRLRYKLLAVLSLLFVARSCGRHSAAPLLNSSPELPHIVIPPSAQAVIESHPGLIVVAKRSPTIPVHTTVTAVPEWGHGSTTIVSKSGDVQVKPRQFGVPFDFGVSSDFQSLGVGTEVMYWKQLDIIGGVHFIDLRSSRLVFDAYVAIGYRLPYKKLSNLSVFAGVDTERHAIIGLFLRLGNS